MNGYARATVLLCGVAMVSAVRVQDFFPEIKNNLTEVTWAHAVNNETYLLDTLEDEEIMMIEADVVLGSTESTGDAIVPIMAHPPVARSDLTLEQFIGNISDHNQYATQGNGTKKGAKLDFKSIEALKQSVEIVKDIASKESFPIWINADILPGPIDSQVKPVNAKEFFEATKDLKNIIYSIGWTTLFGPKMKGSYSDAQIEQMINATVNITTEITFPVRAGLAAESLDQMKQLLKKASGSTLTIWSSEGDNVNVTNLNTLINEIGVDKVYIDVPEGLMDQIRIKPHQNGAAGVGGVLAVSLAVVMAIFTQLF